MRNIHINIYNGNTGECYEKKKNLIEKLIDITCKITGRMRGFLNEYVVYW